MNKKIVLLLLFLFSAILSPSAYAESHNSLSGVAETIEELFGFIPNIITLEKLLGEDAAAMFWARFLLWVLLFAVFYYGGSFAFKVGEKVSARIAGTVAFVFATISALLIPEKIITGIFQSYGLLSAILIWFVPVMAGFFLVSKIPTRPAKALIYLGMIFVLVAIDDSITSNFAADLADTIWFAFFKLLLAVVIIAFLWNLLFAGIEGWNAAVPGGGHGPAPGPHPPGQEPGPAPPGHHPPAPGPVPGRRPAGQRPPATPARRNPADPPTPDGVAPPGINPHAPGPRPIPERMPREPRIPDEEEIYIDLSGNFAPIRSQDRLGACTAFAATSIFEYVLHVGYQVPMAYLSPLFLWYRTRETIGAVNVNHGPRTCAIPMQNLVEHGVCFEDFWPFAGSDNPRWTTPPSQDAIADANQKRILTFRSLDGNDTDQWVHALRKEYPINIGVAFPIDMVKPYRKHLYDNFGVRSTHGLHAMVIVGYYSHYPYNGAGIKAFKIRNSHDVDWGENGYTWVPAEVLKSMLFEDPIIIYGWNKKESSGQRREDLEGRSSAEQLRKYAEEELKGLAAELESVNLLKELISKNNYKEAFQLLERIEKVEQAVSAFEGRIEGNLSQLKNKVQEPLKSLIANVEKSLKANAKKLAGLITKKNGLHEHLAHLAGGDIKEHKNSRARVETIIKELENGIRSVEADLRRLLEASGGVRNC